MQFFKAVSKPFYAPQGFTDEIGREGEIIPGEWRSEATATLVPLEPTKHKNVKMHAKEVRERFREYFDTLGAIPWQCSYAKVV